ncbi:MAG: hypothetical protein H0Z37_04980 [Firmicutes bacterium]|nr:hypothetical protein [Bacillota bacterium]
MNDWPIALVFVVLALAALLAYLAWDRGRLARGLQRERDARVRAERDRVAGASLQAVASAGDFAVAVLLPDKRPLWISPGASRFLDCDGDLRGAVERSLATGQPQQARVRLPGQGLDLEARVFPIVDEPPLERPDIRPESSASAVEGPSTEGRSAFEQSRALAVVVTFSEGEMEKRLQQMRREFVANVSHELRSPLTSILGYSQTLLEDPPDDPEQARRFLMLIAREAERMQRLVADLLNLSRIESGRTAPRLEGVNLHNLVGRVLTQLKDKAAQAQVELGNRVPLDLRAECDPGQMEQVVYNLVTNGIQYTPAGGRVVVSGRWGQDTVTLEVQDTGIGIPAADLPRVFERFYRVDKARSRATGGTGLGLSIVKHIVDAHNGRVSVESQVGQGTTFRVELPLRRKPSPAG